VSVEAGPRSEIFGFERAGGEGAAGEGYVYGAVSGEGSLQQPLGSQLQLLTPGASLRPFQHSPISEDIHFLPG